ncbi:MAG: hypothetical protein R3275_02775 [Saprospiraceae bacterium]|nr:hypothetical protein [Saprospiraceae bacterium]
MKKLLLLSTLFIWSCNYDEIRPEQAECSEAVTYESHVREIVGLKCATSGCHVPGGDGTGDFTSYESMRTWLNENFFEKVIRDGSMPPAGSPNLTEQERETLLCWIESNYQEN